MKLIYGIGYSLFRALARGALDYDVVHRERLIEDGPAVIACNHASFMDPPMVGIAFREEIHFLARKTLFRGFGGWLYPRWNAIPVDQEGSDMTSLKKIIKHLREGKRVLIFPEGERSRTGGLLAGQAGIGLVVAKAQVPVLPVRLFGTYESLPRGASWPQITRVTLVVGERLDFGGEEYRGGGRATYQQVSDRIMEAIAGLELPPDRDPYGQTGHG